MDSFFVLEDGVTYLVTDNVPVAYFVTEDHTGGDPTAGGGNLLLLKAGI